jgi:hypothetical protein
LQDAAQETLAYNMLHFKNMQKVLNSDLQNLKPSQDFLMPSKTTLFQDANLTSSVSESGVSDK